MTFTFFRGSRAAEKAFERVNKEKIEESNQ